MSQDTRSATLPPPIPFRLESFAPETDANPLPVRTVSSAAAEVMFEILQPHIGLVLWSRPMLDATHLTPLLNHAPFTEHIPDLLTIPAPTWLREDIAWLNDLTRALAFETRTRCTFRTNATPEKDPPEILRLSCHYAGTGLWHLGTRLHAVQPPFTVAITRGPHPFHFTPSTPTPTLSLTIEPDPSEKD